MNRMWLGIIFDCVSKKNAQGEFQCRKTVCEISGWLCWAVRQELVWRSPSRRHRRERALLSLPVVRKEFRRQLNPLAEKRRDRHLMSRTNEPLQPSFPS